MRISIYPIIDPGWVRSPTIFASIDLSSHLLSRGRIPSYHRGRLDGDLHTSSS